MKELISAPEGVDERKVHGPGGGGRVEVWRRRRFCSAEDSPGAAGAAGI